MKLDKRIKQIVALTVEDFYGCGYSTNESQESLKAWLCDTLMQDESIEDAHTYEISLKVLEMLKSLDIVDLEFIHSLLFADAKPSEANITLSFVFDEVRL